MAVTFEQFEQEVNALTIVHDSEKLLHTFSEQGTESGRRLEPEVDTHSMRVANGCTVVAWEADLSLREAATLRVAGIGHDFGKWGCANLVINSAVLLCDTDQSDTMRAEQRRHPEISLHLLHAMLTVTEADESMKQKVGLYVVTHHGHHRNLADNYPSENKLATYRKNRSIPVLEPNDHDFGAVLSVVDCIDAIGFRTIGDETRRYVNERLKREGYELLPGETMVDLATRIAEAEMEPMPKVLGQTTRQIGALLKQYEVYIRTGHDTYIK